MLSGAEMAFCSQKYLLVESDKTIPEKLEVDSDTIWMLWKPRLNKGWQLPSKEFAQKQS